MKLKKKVFPLLLSLIITPCLFAQKISYTYDSAGNRISRQYVVELRSATVPKAEGIDSTSVETFLEDLSVSVYPNPTKGALAVKATNVPKDKKVSMKLYSPQGMQLQSIDIIEGTTPINMSTYSSGWYLLRVSTGEKALDFKIIKI
ncbi:MAG: T9SS type A sorting domain-containing protein [Bacteroidales bacterium]|nr:T9SS type A sorting domain-containing protein [Bacteroidales bacterium]